MNCIVRNTEESQVVTLSIADKTENVKARLPEGATLTGIIYSVDIQFDGTGTLSLGISTAKTKFLSAVSITTAGATLKTVAYTGAKGGEDLYFSIGGTPTVGAATVILQYYTKNVYTAQY